MRLETKRVSLRVLSISGNQSLDTSISTGRLMLAVIGAVGQAEREAMLERQREGIAKWRDCRLTRASLAPCFAN